ncbi:FAD-binding and (Fe-S)-binding domain-containing protein [Croceiramulus getboli]|nr:FAD-linked oxidase C-terminal domain-containing protein [Flavobacteriaceae bacterium YJPT1-3]
MHDPKNDAFLQLSTQLDGELLWDSLHRALYATDASVYRRLPLAVAYPKHQADLQSLIAFAKANQIGLIPRTAGTSLAGQCVGEGIVVDVSRHCTRIIDLDLEAGTVCVEPGVVRDELNRYLKPYGLFFGPNTSTSNRCMIGGMVGNNSSGTTSIKYGVTRDKIIRLEGLLSDGSPVVFENLSKAELEAKCAQSDREGRIYASLIETLSHSSVQEEIRAQFPDARVHRRNTGYALDTLLDMQPFTTSGPPLNLAALLAGSEGTLVFTTRVTLQLDSLPPEHGVMVVPHFESIEKCLLAVAPAMQHQLETCEMIDRTILDCTKNNKEQQANRFFVHGDPKAILMLEIRDASQDKAQARAAQLMQSLESLELPYATAILSGTEIDQALELRKAGLGLLGNMVGDRKAVACIEDTAVPLDDLAEYINEFTALMADFGQEAVYYAHAGAGELHLRPILNLKQEEDVQLFREITTAVAKLVKKYKGSLSGEHGDGIVRAEFIEMMIGTANYKLLEQVKKLFDPENLFNPGKIVAALPMDEGLRYTPGRTEPEIKTRMDFSANEGILRAAEQCNGSGDCRKSAEAGGAMCPSYQATKNEKDSTRARANALREFLTQSEQRNRFDHQELKEVFDLCISCKACARECPSNVDVATLKAEFEYQYKKANGSSLRTKAFAYNGLLNKGAAPFRGLVNQVYTHNRLSTFIKRHLRIAEERTLPVLKPFRAKARKSEGTKGKVVLFIDEFSQYLDGPVAQDALDLLEGLGYEVTLIKNRDSGRTYISKGFLKQAQRLANKNVQKLKSVVGKDTPLLGLEPSALLTFRDEYLKLAHDRQGAQELANHSFLIEEFLADQIQQGIITAAQFTEAPAKIKIHGHCHQKALAGMKSTFDVLNLPINYKPTLIPSGCCGMAGSFGYEKEHYEVSMQVGELTLFPAVRKADTQTIIVANGTSCRHQILDGTGREAVHPVTVMRSALRSMEGQD